MMIRREGRNSMTRMEEEKELEEFWCCCLSCLPFSILRELRFPDRLVGKCPGGDWENDRY
jgi:hypothetical protein